MDFSDLSKFSGLACFSQDGRLLATTDQHRIVIRHADTLQPVHTFTCLDAISCLSFSPDSTLIFGAQYKRRIIQVFSLIDERWFAKIDEALSGLTHAQWTPDSRHIVTASEFNLRLSVWSLTRKNVMYIKQPKLIAIEPGAAPNQIATATVPSEANGAFVRFSNSGMYMAVLTRIDCKDIMNIYCVGTEDPPVFSASTPPVSSTNTGGWELLKQFPIDTEDCVHFEWAPSDAQIVCIDSSVTYNFVLYTPSGQRLSQTRLDTDTAALGIKPAGTAVKWSPSSSFLAVGSYDQQLRLYNNTTGQCCIAYSHTASTVNAHAAGKKATLVLYAEKPLNPGHVLTKLHTLSGVEEKENHDETNGTGGEESSPRVEDVKPRSAASASSSAATSSTTAGKRKPPIPTVGMKKAGSSSSLLKSTSGVAVKKPVTVSAATSSSSSASTRKPSPTAASSSSLSSSSSAFTEDKSTYHHIPSKYVIDSLPLQLTSLTPPLDAVSPKIGVGIVAWSVGDRYLVTRNDNTPHTVWIWDTQKLGLISILTQLDPVRCIAWDPKRARFALCTSTAKLYLWSPEGCSIVDVPLQAGQIFQVRKIEWNKEGTCILLMDKNKFCCCYMRD